MIGSRILDMAKSSKFNQGFTYIGLLILIAIAGIGMSAVGIMWQTEMRRERELQLMHIGAEYKKAIISYRDATPGGVKQNPRKLEDLVSDRRLPITKRHLRKLYHDPITNTKTWGLLIEQEAIIGIYSASPLEPIKRSGFPAEYEMFEDAKSYADWQFIS